MTITTLLAFAGLCLLLSLTPGPDTFLVLRIALIRVPDWRPPRAARWPG